MGAAIYKYFLKKQKGEVIINLNEEGE